MGAYTGGAEEPDGKPGSFAVGAVHDPRMVGAVCGSGRYGSGSGSGGSGLGIPLPSAS